MCGIAGTVFNANFFQGEEITILDLKRSIEGFKNNTNNSEILLEQAWKYKSNINFLRFCKNASEKEDLKNLCKLIKVVADKKRIEISNIDKSSSLEPYKKAVKECEQIMDTHWFLSEEIYRWVATIEEISNAKVGSLDDTKIIFYKDICKVIHAIDNRLELRGRDSLGLSILINSDNFQHSIKDYPLDDHAKESYYLYSNSRIQTHTFTFKTCNSIGALGDNATEIKNLLNKNKFFKKLIQHGNVKSATIMAHTRWASVGSVNIQNAHPASLINNSDDNNNQTLALLNGDIYNYKEIIKDAEKDNKKLINASECTNDSLAIPAYLLNKSNLDLKTAAAMASNFSGSFAISIQHTANFENITLLKKGIQGLYLGFSYDGMMFASDVYGLVEACRFFMPVDSDTAMNISSINCSSVDNIQLEIMDIKSGDLKLFSKKDLQITNITTRDIDKRGYDHFLEKEIYETSDIVERTINGYLQPEMALDMNNLISAISMDNTQVPDFITSSLQKKEIKKVIITGMGTCYTAAVAISMYMRARLKVFIPEVVVEPHIASEGSAFYIEPNMQDTLVIVIAQSGTTVDTNVYVQMAKERGAMSLAIANKREGDVTFIVDGTVYIGEGRDIEIAVPSTKTYTAQVILGYILTLYFSSHLVKNEEEKLTFVNDLRDLRSSNDLIFKSFNVLNNKVSFEEINNYGCKHNSWYVLRDSSSNGVCADELRIKYSENCYQSVSSLSLSEAKDIQIKNSFITLISELPLSELSADIIELNKLGNSLALIVINGSVSDELTPLLERGEISLINMPKASKHFSFLPTVLAGQFLSYYLAKALDQRKKYFIDIKESLFSTESLNKSFEVFEKKIKDGYFNQGFSVLDFIKLSKLITNYKNDGMDVNNTAFYNVDKHLEHLIQLTRRTIDTIKHQAKTITVGAVRENMQEQSPHINFESVPESASLSIKDDSLLKEIHSCFDDSLLKEFNFLKDQEILIAYSGIDESFAYNLVNFINDFLSQINSHNKVRLAHDYDHPSKTKKSSANWLVISNSSISTESSFLKFLDKNQYINFNFSEFLIPKSISSFFYYENQENEQYKKAIWSLFLSIFLSNKLFFNKIISLSDDNSLSKKVNFKIEKNLQNFTKAISTIENSTSIESSITYAVKTYLSRTNWKCIGSGTNYNLSKYTSKRLIAEINRACAFDVLENHKHIDMSAESSIIVFISNIWKHGYQEDAFSEIEKLISHNSLPIIVTNQSDDRYDNFSLLMEDSNESQVNLPVPVIKIPKLGQHYSFAANILLVEKFIENMTNFISSDDSMIHNKVAIETPQRNAS
tara:strand:- start:5547 stop:9485 length:3939 start_codon:yes stop_codon:yes gene_type:complete